MSSSKDKALWNSSRFQSRTPAERKAYRAKIKANLAARNGTTFAAMQAERRKAQREFDKAWAANPASRP